MNVKKLNRWLALFLIAMLYVVYSTGLTEKIMGYASNSIQDIESDIYDVNFVLSKTPMGNINTYIPRYVETEEDTAIMLAGWFGMPPEYEDDGEAFIFSDEIGTLVIYKDISLLRYTAHEQSLITGTGYISEREALAAAAAFNEENLLFDNYEEALVDNDITEYQIKFINRIGNIKNYAFHNTTVIDKRGNIKSVEHYFLSYDKLNSCRIKSVKEAFYELPEDLLLPEGTVVDLKSCQIVYIFENSIIQPAYLFAGELPDGKSYQCFIKAAVFE